MLYQYGWTPNPDVMCNEHIKFRALIQASSQYNVDLVATGHYARLCQDVNGVLTMTFCYYTYMYLCCQYS